MSGELEDSGVFNLDIIVAIVTYFEARYGEMEKEINAVTKLDVKSFK